ncbi:MAG TPA: DUF732 domain-containing protein [Mycobacterium sp.]|uniref:DUF732 domain-containing protein n=1 Tax=Mycobacterium sp. TaxID=1785 RepID=UPI002B762259|nr:DUF732 domain-containing protein [Mycobacterium sp.]HME75664.1 DUF732 domain-containing protein [Mycobacterium sp.]
MSGIRGMRTVLVIGALRGGGGVAAAIPAQAQVPDDFLDHLNSVGIGSHDDKHNSDLVGFGNVICWRLYGGEAPGQITEMVITNSRFGGGRELTRQQAEAAVRFAISDLCPDAAPD